MSKAAIVALDAIRSNHHLQARQRESGEIVAEQIHLALGPWTRFRGLLARPELAPGHAMLLRPCRAIHTMFMGYAIDVVFLATDGTVAAIERELAPWGFSQHYGTALATLELSGGALREHPLRVGDVVEFFHRRC